MSNNLPLGNEQYRQAMTAQVMQTLGVNLTAITQGENLKQAALNIEEFFWKELGLDAPLLAANKCRASCFLTAINYSRTLIQKHWPYGWHRYHWRSPPNAALWQRT